MLILTTQKLREFRKDVQCRVPPPEGGEFWWTNGKRKTDNQKPESRERKAADSCQQVEAAGESGKVTPQAERVKNWEIRSGVVEGATLGWVGGR